MFSDVPAVDDGSKMAQIFVGRTSGFTGVYGCKSESEFSRKLEDNIRQNGSYGLPD